MAKRDLLRRVEQAEGKLSALFGLDGKGSAVDQLARRIRAFDLLKEIMPLGEDWEPDADQIADIAHQTGISIEQVCKVISVHNTVLCDFEENY